MTRANKRNQQQVTLDALNENLEINFAKTNSDLLGIKNDILEMRNVIIANLVNENKVLREKVEKLEEKMQNVDTDVQLNNQYCRRNNIEIKGIPHTIPQEELENKVVDLIVSSGINITKFDIEACHRLPFTKKEVKEKKKDKKVIVRFVNRKISELAILHQKKIDKSTLGFPPNTQIFVNRNLNKYFERLLWKCRLLKRNNLIVGFKFQNESVIIERPNQTKQKVVYERELDKFFPEFSFE